MRRTRRAVAGMLAAAVVLVATSCYAPSQTPTYQPIPPGGKVIATGATLKDMWIEATTPDLSVILYGQDDPVANLIGTPTNAYWVYDDHTGHTTTVPRGHSFSGFAALSPDGHSVVFTSNDRALQVDPTTPNCYYGSSALTTRAPTWCNEFYLLNVDTGQTRQLTGLTGSSTVDNGPPTFTDDGQGILFSTDDPASYNPSFGYHRLDLATGEITDATPPPVPTSWDRGTHHVVWDGTAGTLTSTDTTTGVAQLLWANSDVYYLAAAIDNGRFIVVSDWVTVHTQDFELIDTDAGTVRKVSSQFISEDGSHYATVQVNVAPDSTDRVIIAPLPPA